MGLMLPRRVSAIGESNGTLPTGAHHDGSLPRRFLGVRSPALCVLRPRLVTMPNPCHDPPIPATITPVARPIALLVEDNREYALIGTRLLEN